MTTTALDALGGRGFLLGRWPWRAAAYLLSSLATATATAGALSLLCLPWLVLALESSWDRPGPVIALLALGALGFGLGGPLLALPLAGWERRRLRLVDPRPVTSGHRPPPATGLAPWVRTRFTEAATWRELGYAVLLATVVLAACVAVLVFAVLAVSLLVSPFLVGGGPVSVGFLTVSTPGESVWGVLGGLVLLAALCYLGTLVAGLHGMLARTLLQGDQLIEVSRSRARLVDAFEAERRRIERDLHDGAQQRLVGLTLRLGLARLDLPADSPAAAQVAAAHDEAKQLMAELREFIHGIRPQVLTERGLPAALGELADRSAVPVTVHSALNGRLPGPLEGTAYFVASEALANAAKHSGAAAVEIDVRLDRGWLRLEVRDNGRGGADPAGGTGLTGLADRVAVLDGRMVLSSPAGGPTVVRVELPCPQSE
ncbi:sensor histidine kinase [Amycolatopsis albispora]|uniref:histidine kinase n=1 Tax=Amycolatopsis albispora TaxID=1804986 RepID=A0A344LI80_9PSEU|nr:sensor histidine kinase [Amycolatopsis albispora]AXB47754.1 histidine kinase [Amycolatopsis albispora]